MAINWDDIAAGGAGALNGLLFDAPDWLLKNLGGRNSGVQKYLDAHKNAFDIGDTIGTVGGAFIPVGGIAHGLGLGAKALKGAEALGNVSKAVDLAKGAGAIADVGGLAAKAIPAAADIAKAAPSALSDIARFVGHGAATGAAESAARGIFDEKTPGEIAQNVSTGAGMGALGGGLAGGISALAPKLAALGKKATEKAVVGTTNATTRGLLQTAQRMSGEGSGPMAQVRNVDSLRRELSDLIKSKKLWKEGAVAKAAEDQKNIWHSLDDVYEKVAGGKTGAEVLAGSLGPDDMAALSQKYDPGTLKSALDTISGPVANRTGMANIRDKLEDIAKAARIKGTGNAEVDNAVYDMAKTIRGNLDDAIVQTARDSGINIPPNFKREYGLLMPIAKGEVKSDIAGTKFGLGSPTFEKAAAASLLGGGSALVGDKNEDFATKAARMAGGAALGFAGSKAIGSLLKHGVAAGDTLAGLAQKAAPVIAGAAPQLATIGARVAANTANAVKAAAPTNQPEAEAAQSGAEMGQSSPKEYMGLVLDRLTSFAESRGVSKDSPDFKEFVQTVAASTMGDDGPFDAKKMAGILYPDPAERAKFTRALDVSRSLATDLTGAMRSSSGLLGSGIGEPVQEKIDRQLSLDKLSAMVGDVAKANGTEKKAKELLSTILNNRSLSQIAKRKMIRGMLENYGVDFDTLSKVGLNGNV